MNTHNVYFCGKIRKNISTFWLKKKKFLSGAMLTFHSSFVLSDNEITSPVFEGD